MTITIGPWVARTTPTSLSRFFAQAGARIVSQSPIYSDDGVIWVDGSTGLNPAFTPRVIATDGTTFVLVGEDNDNEFETAAYSVDGGETWTMATVGLASDTMSLRDVVSLDGVGFVAFSEDDTAEVAISSDGGATWVVSTPTGLPLGLRNPVASGSRIVAVNGGYDGLVSSTDGLAWTDCTLPAFDGTPVFAVPVDSRGGLWTGTQFAFLFTDDTGPGAVLSADGVTFTISRFTGVTAPTAIGYDVTNGIVVVLENTESPDPVTLFASDDFATFTPSNAPWSESALTWFSSEALFVSGGTTIETAIVTTGTPPATPNVPTIGNTFDADGGVGDGLAISLSWPAVTGAVTYALYRSRTRFGPFTVAAPSILATTPAVAYTDTVDAYGTTFYYYTTATNGDGTSDPSETASGISGSTLTSPWVPPADVDSTDATTSLYSAIRDTLLGYTDPAIADPQYQLAALLAGVNGGQDRVFIRNVPNVNNVAYPYVTILLDQISLAGSNTYARRAQLEVQVVGKPAAQGPLIEWIADRIDRCLLSLLLTSEAGQTATDYGIVRVTGGQRATLPPFTTPAETDVYGVRLVYDLWMYPRVLTSPRIA